MRERGGSAHGSRCGLVVGEAFYLLNCHSLTWSIFAVGLFSNPCVWNGIAGKGILQLAFTYAPFMQRAFGSEAIDGSTWIAILAFATFLHALIGIEKWLRRRAPRTRALEFDTA